VIDHPLTFAQLRAANLERCGGSFQPLEDWSLTDWATALAGEVGEACNLIKKGRRGEPIERAALVDELADAQIYLDLIAARLGVDLGAAVAHKFNVVSERRRSAARLHPDLDRGVPCELGRTLPSYFSGMPGMRYEDVPAPSNPKGTGL
jgi:NTP pyrophosphatase (non-canonical NTP hydrolase)